MRAAGRGRGGPLSLAVIGALRARAGRITVDARATQKQLQPSAARASGLADGGATARMCMSRSYYTSARTSEDLSNQRVQRVVMRHGQEDSTTTTDSRM